MGGRRGKIAIALALAALGAGAMPGVAGEQGDPNLGDELLGKDNGIRYNADSVAFDPLNSGYASAESGCGGEAWHLIGGGLAAQSPAPESQASASRGIDYSDPGEEPDDGYLASGFGAKRGAMTSFSVCRKGGGLSYVREDVPDHATASRSATIACNGSKPRITSGGTFIATTESWTNSSYPIDGGDRDRAPDDGWKGRVHDTAGGPGAFSMSAVCSKTDKLSYVRAKPLRIPSRASRTRIARCEGKSNVVGGGAKLSGKVATGKLLRSHPDDDDDLAAVPDNGWRAAAYNAGGAAKKLTVFAICVR